MSDSRRRLLLMSFAAIGSLLLRFKGAVGQTPVPRVHPPKPTTDSDDDASNPAPPGSSKALLEQRQKDIRKEIEKLYNLASQLKAEIERTDATTVLSLAMVKKAEEIERLAKQIKENAKG